MLTWRRPVLTAACVMCVIALIGAGRSSGAPARSSGAFELVVKDAEPLKAGTTRIRSRSAVASRVHGLVPGNADGIKLVFATTPDVRSGDYAAMVLFLDRDDRVTQVNLSYVVPGTTVARTVAWRPEDLRKQFSDVSIRGGRVALKSKGTYSEIEAGREALTLTWDVDVDLPVIREVTR
jgi:hypothetical protein